MAQFLVTVEVTVRGLTTDVEHGIREILDEHFYYPKNIKVEYSPEPTRLSDFPPKMVRRRTGGESYRVVIPGLVKDGHEVTVPVWEEGFDLELLTHILDNEGS